VLPGGKELWQQLKGGTWPAGWRRVGDVIGKQHTWLTLEEEASLVRDRLIILFQNGLDPKYHPKYHKVPSMFG
jgi:hypothetical protein